MTVSRLLNVPFFFDRVTIVFPGVWKQSAPSLERFIRKKVPAFTKIVRKGGPILAKGSLGFPRYKEGEAADHGAAFYAGDIDQLTFQKILNAWRDWVKSEGHSDKFSDDVWGGSPRLQRSFPRTRSNPSKEPTKADIEKLFRAQFELGLKDLLDHYFKIDDPEK